MHRTQTAFDVAITYLALFLVPSFFVGYRWGQSAGLYTAAGLLIFRAIQMKVDGDWEVTTPPIPAKRATPGQIAIVQGTARSTDILTSPVSQTPSVFHQVDISAQRILNDDGLTHKNQEWQAVNTRRLGGFFVVDESGEVFVLPQGAHLHIEPQHSALSEGLDAFEEQRHHTEYLLKPGQFVSVAGTARTAEEALEFARTHEGADLTEKQIGELQARVTRGDPLLCFFSDGRSLSISDRPHSRLSGTNSAIFWALLALAAFLALNGWALSGHAAA